MRPRATKRARPEDSVDRAGRHPGLVERGLDQWTSLFGAGKLSRSTLPLLSSAQWVGSSGRLSGACGLAHRYSPSLRELRRPVKPSMIARPAVVNTIIVLGLPCPSALVNRRRFPSRTARPFYASRVARSSRCAACAVSSDHVDLVERAAVLFHGVGKGPDDARSLMYAARRHCRKGSRDRNRQAGPVARIRPGGAGRSWPERAGVGVRLFPSRIGAGTPRIGPGRRCPGQEGRAARCRG